MTYLEKYKILLYRFLKENNFYSKYEEFQWDLDENNLPSDLPHTLMGSFYDVEESIIEKYEVFFNERCIDIFANDIICFIKRNSKKVTNIDKIEIINRLKNKYIIHYLVDVCKIASNRKEIIKLFYNTII